MHWFLWHHKSSSFKMDGFCSWTVADWTVRFETLTVFMYYSKLFNSKETWEIQFSLIWKITGSLKNRLTDGSLTNPFWSHTIWVWKESPPHVKGSVPIIKVLYSWQRFYTIDKGSIPMKNLQYNNKGYI